MTQEAMTRERRSPKELNLKSTKKTKTPGAGSTLPPLDWARGHGPITGALSATTGAAAAALLGTATGMPEGWPLLIGAAGAVGHGIGHSVHRKLTLRTAVARAASWLVAGGWTAWAMAHGPLSWVAAGSLAALGVGIGAAASHTAAWEEVAEEERFTTEARAAAAEMDGRRRTIAGEWQDRIKRVCMVDVKVVAVEFWETGAGFSIEAELPGGGVTWDRISSRSRALAADARLPLGCTVHVEEGAAQGLVVVDIMTKNIMREEKLYPEDYSPLSILTGIPWCLRPNGEAILVFLREACALLLGPPGSGKSTFMDVILAGFARCTDVLTWVIDLKQGAIGIPWVTPWLEAKGLIEPDDPDNPAPAGTRPGVDWLAATPKEAIRMLKAALRINKARQLRYQKLMRQQDTTLLPISPELPQIEIVIDEGAEALAHANNRREPEKRELAELIKEVMRTTRAMGIRKVLTAVDGNLSTIGDTVVKRFSPLSIALTSGENSGHNVGKLFPKARIDSTQLNEKGAGIIGDSGANGFAPTEFKGWKSLPSMVRRVVLATNDRRPTLDQISVEAAGTDYSERWTQERAGWLVTAAEAVRNGETDDQAPGTTGTVTAVLDKPEPPAAGDDSGRRHRSLNLSYQRRAEGEDPDELAAKLLAQIEETYGTTDEPDRTRRTDRERPRGLNLSYNRDDHPAPPSTDPDDATADQDPADAESSGHREGSGVSGPDWLAEAIDAIESAGPMGMKPSAIADMVGRDRKTIRAGLRAAAERGQLVYRDNGPHSVYVHPDHT
ncbi:P-loop NTPase family protein [Streptomyces milbemycinicus]|uniref:Rhodanese domain-containing protein n=1 Tax=Streptomyces milbemycinicus TaxID=476552 RepID=A0ABW8LHF3_9ACTN